MLLARQHARGRAERLRATTTTHRQGQQELRDIPQSVTVVTEKLIDDRNLDTLKDALHNTAGISFLAAEGGEEDIRLRGFSLQATGDIFVDGMRDPAFYERDTFNYDRSRCCAARRRCCSAAAPPAARSTRSARKRLIDEHQVDLTLGSHGYLRTGGRLQHASRRKRGAARQRDADPADNNGAGSASTSGRWPPRWRWGIGTRDEFSAQPVPPGQRNGMNYGMPWIRPTRHLAGQRDGCCRWTPRPTTDGQRPQRGSATYADGLQHTTASTQGASSPPDAPRRYDRDQRASAIRFAQRRAAARRPGREPGHLRARDTCSTAARTTEDPGPGHLVRCRATTAASSRPGLKHEVQAGVDLAREERVFAAQRSAAQGGVVPAKPHHHRRHARRRRLVDEDSRVCCAGTSNYESTRWGVYAQDLVQVAPALEAAGRAALRQPDRRLRQLRHPQQRAGPVTDPATA
jgi:catecholate siderophore receptor